MREITVRPQRFTKVVSLDEKGPGGAYHAYRIETIPQDPMEPIACWDIFFQKGGIHDQGNVRGVTNEDLLAIVIDRLECFQAGPFSCTWNEQALHHARRALDALDARTRDREDRGVEGKSVA